MMLGRVSGRLVGAMAVGNSGSNYGYVTGSYGTLTPATFTDSAGNVRTIDIWNWDNQVSGTVGFRLHGTSITNSDATFISVNIGGRVLTRAAAAYTANDGGGRTQWSWAANTSAYPLSGTVAAIVS